MNSFRGKYILGFSFLQMKLLTIRTLFLFPVAALITFISVQVALILSVPFSRTIQQQVSGVYVTQIDTSLFSLLAIVASLVLWILYSLIDDKIIRLKTWSYGKITKVRRLYLIYMLYNALIQLYHIIRISIVQNVKMFDFNTITLILLSIDLMILACILIYFVFKSSRYKSYHVENCQFKIELADGTEIPINLKHQKLFMHENKDITILNLLKRDVTKYERNLMHEQIASIHIGGTAVPIDSIE